MLTDSDGIMNDSICGFVSLKRQERGTTGTWQVLESF